MSRKEKPDVTPDPAKAEREAEVETAEPEAEPTVEERLAALSTERDEVMDRLLRLTAEFENYRKRLARERSSWTARAVETLVLDILPALDSFDRAMLSAGESDDPAALRDGMELVHRQLLSALSSHGVAPIDALGQPFDPNLHEGFLSRPAGPGEVPGTIVEEVEKGYRLGDRTIRATKGIVAAAEDDSGSSASPEEE
ncbi:MAG: nucleotide exchange factor GrpE [Planctomycetota bacterium]|jgi:molecular chaperone GrpE